MECINGDVAQVPVGWWKGAKSEDGALCGTVDEDVCTDRLETVEGNQRHAFVVLFVGGDVCGTVAGFMEV